MRYLKRVVDSEWPLDTERPRQVMRGRKRGAPMSPRATRRMAKMDAQLLALAAGLAEHRTSQAPTAPPPAPVRVVVPPPLPITFPFPFANAASPTFTMEPTDDEHVDVHDSWLLPPPPDSVSYRPAT